MVEEKVVKLNLGCGNRKVEGFLGVDMIKTPVTDIIWDFRKIPWEFATDNSVDEIDATNLIEHIEDLFSFMNECYRILKVGGKMTIKSPYYTSVRAWQDATHKRTVSEASFLYYNKKWREDNHLEHYPITADFDFTWGYLMYPEWNNRSDEAKQFAIQHYWNVVADIQVTLTKR